MSGQWQWLEDGDPSTHRGLVQRRQLVRWCKSLYTAIPEFLYSCRFPILAFRPITGSLEKDTDSLYSWHSPLSLALLAQIQTPHFLGSYFALWISDISVSYFVTSCIASLFFLALRANTGNHLSKLSLQTLWPFAKLLWYLLALLCTRS